MRPRGLSWRMPQAVPLPRGERDPFARVAARRWVRSHTSDPRWLPPGWGGPPPAAYACPGPADLIPDLTRSNICANLFEWGCGEVRMEGPQPGSAAAGPRSDTATSTGSTPGNSADKPSAICTSAPLTSSRRPLRTRMPQARRGDHCGEGGTGRLASGANRGRAWRADAAAIPGQPVRPVRLRVPNTG
jgi:hypothetical protein